MLYHIPRRQPGLREGSREKHDTQLLPTRALKSRGAKPWHCLPSVRALSTQPTNSTHRTKLGLMLSLTSHIRFKVPPALPSVSTGQALEAGREVNCRGPKRSACLRPKQDSPEGLLFRISSVLVRRGASPPMVPVCRNQHPGYRHLVGILRLQMGRTPLWLSVWDLPVTLMSNYADSMSHFMETTPPASSRFLRAPAELSKEKAQVASHCHLPLKANLSLFQESQNKCFQSTRAY